MRDIPISDEGNILLALIQRERHLHCCKPWTGHRNIAVDFYAVDFWDIVWSKRGEKRKEFMTYFTPNKWCGVALFLCHLLEYLLWCFR